MPGRGLQYLPMNDIPEEWDRVWFRDFVKDVLSLADVRNAIEGAGISIEGNSDTEATIGTGTDVEQLIDGPYVIAEPYSFLANARLLAGENGVIDIEDDGPGQPITVEVQEGGIKNAKIRPGRECSVIGRAANSVGFVSDIISSANDTLLTRIADVLAWTQLTVGMAPDDLWTYAKIQNISAQFLILGRKSASAGDTEECTLSEILDFIGSAAQGDILYRGASSWARLPAGTDGEVLTTHGAAADPTWEAGGGGGGAMSFIADNAVSGSAATTLAVSGLDLDADQEYYVRIEASNATGSAANLSLYFNADTTATNYDRQALSVNGTTVSGSRANDALIGGLNTTGGVSINLTIRRRLDDTVVVLAHSLRGITTTIQSQSFDMAWRTSATNVTSITLSSSVANSLAVGSSIQVFRIHD